MNKRLDTLLNKFRRKKVIFRLKIMVQETKNKQTIIGDYLGSSYWYYEILVVLDSIKNYIMKKGNITPNAPKSPKNYPKKQ